MKILFPEDDKDKDGKGQDKIMSHIKVYEQEQTMIKSHKSIPLRKVKPCR